MYSKLLILIVVILAVTLGYSQQEKGDDELVELTVAQVKEKMESDEDVFLLDVRTTDEYNGPAGNIEGTVLIPLHELEERLQELNDYKDYEIIVICLGGYRSRTGARLLIKHKFKACNMTGGMIAWNKMQSEMKGEDKIEDTDEE